MRSRINRVSLCATVALLTLNAPAPASADDVSGPEPRADTSRELRADPPTLRLVK